MNAIILEDEQLASNRLQRMLKELAPDIRVVATFESIEDTKEYLKNNPNIQIMFLDIHVADGNSMELLEGTKYSAKIIFTTAYDEYAIEAFRKNAIDYLLKPLKMEQLAEAISRVDKPSKYLNDTYQERILVKFMNKIKSIRSSEIAYVFSKNKISYFYLKDGTRIASEYKLQEVEEQLNPYLFFRANRQFIINIDSIHEIKKHLASRVKISLIPAIQEDLVVSTEKTPLFKKWLDR